jgi:hypothetical protein
MNNTEKKFKDNLSVILNMIESNEPKFLFSGDEHPLASGTPRDRSHHGY